MTGVEDIAQKCSMCDEEEATVTLKPCGHKFCPGVYTMASICVLL